MPFRDDKGAWDALASSPERGFLRGGIHKAVKISSQDNKFKAALEVTRPANTLTLSSCSVLRKQLLCFLRRIGIDTFARRRKSFFAIAPI